jgi:hypothetical protein
MTLPVNNLTVEELLQANAWAPGMTVQALANSTLQLTATSTYQLIFTGTTAGQIVKLPDATTLQNGHRVDIYNTSATQTYSLQDFGNTQLTLGLFSSTVRAVLQSNATSAGTWVFTALQTGVSSGVINYKVTASASFAPGTADTVVTSMTVTPGAGTYAVWYHGSCQITLNNTTLTTSIFNGATQVTDSIRTIASSVSTFNTNHATQTTAQFNGTNACSVHVSRTGGTFTATGRSLILIRLGD